MVQMGRSVVGNCWRKVGICGVVWVCESIRMEMNMGFLLL